MEIRCKEHESFTGDCKACIFAHRFESRFDDLRSRRDRLVQELRERLLAGDSFRTMHASLMRRMGGRLEVARDNMGHAGNTGSITLDVYSKSWWDERVDAVTRVVEAVFTEPEEEVEEGKVKNGVTLLEPLRKGGSDDSWVPFWVPQGGKPDQNSR
jgi:hypothetical protein